MPMELPMELLMELPMEGGKCLWESVGVGAIRDSSGIARNRVHHEGTG